MDADYRVSEAELESEKEERLAEIRGVGLSERFAVCPPDVVSSVERHLREKYGGVREYLLGIVGVSDETIARVYGIGGVVGRLPARHIPYVLPQSRHR